MSLVHSLRNLREDRLARTKRGRRVHRVHPVSLLEGLEMRRALHALARDFDEIARPKHGRYAREPAHADASGITSVPPKE